jgi:uncharacterized LabA/DUF88 family protein
MLQNFQTNTVYVFIDASNLWEAQKARGRMFDYGKLRNVLKTKFNAHHIQIYYYTAYPADGTRDYNLDGKHRFFTYLKKGLKFNVIKKELKRITIHGKNEDIIEEKGNMDVEITIDAIIHIKKYDQAIFFTGDSDFLSLITYLRNNGKKVFVFSTKNNVSNELRTGTDGYFDVLLMEDDIWGRELERRNNTRK